MHDLNAAKETFNVAIVLEKKLGGKTFAEVVNDQVIASKHQTIICVDNENAILPNK